MRSIAKGMALLASALCLAACNLNRAPPPKPEIPSLANALGKGWQCYASPSGFNAPGTIFSLDKKGVKRDEGDLSDQLKVQEAQRALGSVDVFQSVTVGMTLSLLKGAVEDLTLKADANASHETSTRITVGNGWEERILALDYQKAKDWAFQHKDLFAAERRIFVVRHAFKTDSVDYQLDSGFLGSLGGDIKYQDLITLSSNLKGDQAQASQPKPNYVLKQTFAKPLRLCVLHDEIIMPPGAAGAAAVVVRPEEKPLPITSG